MNLIDSSLRALAGSQHGMFTTAQAAVFGLDSRAMTALTREGQLLHPTRGIYAVAALVDTGDEPWHLHRAFGGTLLYPDAVLTGVTALLVHGIPVWGSDLARPRLLRPIVRSAAASGLWVRPIHDPQGRTIDTPWGPVVDIPTAIVQTALDDGGMAGLVSADAALHGQQVTLEDLSARVIAVARWPRSTRADFMLNFCDGRRESVGESRLGVTLDLTGVEVEPQVEIRDARGAFVARVDFKVKGRMVVIEFDGRMKYLDGDAKVLWAEKRREDALRALGYTIVRVVWSDLDSPARLMTKIRRALVAHDELRKRTAHFAR